MRRGVAIGCVSLLALSGSGAFACEDAARDGSRIAIAGGSLTEIVFALGEEARIVAADRTSNYPPAALALPSVGYVRNLSAEGLLSLAPTLVLGEHDMGPENVVAQVASAGVEVVRVPEVHTMNGIAQKVACVARVLGLDSDRLQPTLTRLSSREAQLGLVSRAKPPKVALLLSLTDGVPTAGGTDTSAHGLLHMAGARNVFADFEGWKPVSLESMADSNPDFIVMPSRGFEAAGGVDGVLAHPAVKLTNAGRNGALIAVDGMAMLGFGPRTLDAAIMLAQAFGTLPKPGS